MPPPSTGAASPVQLNAKPTYKSEVSPGSVADRLRWQLEAELAQPRPPPQIIVADEYKRLLELASFRCPLKRKLIWCNDRGCPARPRPCESCPSMAEWLTVFDAKPSEELRDRAFKKLAAKCGECKRFNEWLEDNTYRGECVAARKARLKIDQVARGEIAVFYGNENWGMPHK